MNRVQEIEARLREIRGLLDNDDADLDALEAEVKALEAERDAILDAAEQREALMRRVAASGNVIASIQHTDAPQEERVFDADSDEYRRAFAKMVMHRMSSDVADMRSWPLGEMTENEKRAFSHTTTNTSEVVLPAGVQARIFDLTTERHAVLGDLTFTQIGGVFPFLQATSIEAGDPTITAEGVADAEMETGWNKVEMTGVEIKPRVRLSRKMQIQSVAAFENWLVAKLAERYGVRKNKMAIDKIKADILAGNKLTPATLDDAGLRSGLSKLKGTSRVVIYANFATIWNVLAGIKDGENRALYIASERTDDPTLKGTIYGNAVKVDDELADGEVLIGDAAAVVANDFAPLSLATAQDVLGGTFDVVHAGYSLSEVRLGDTRAWVLITVGGTPSGSASA